MSKLILNDNAGWTFPVRTSRRPVREVTLASGKTYRMSDAAAQPDCDICSECHEHAEWIEDEDGLRSECCGAGAYSTDVETDYER